MSLYLDTSVIVSALTAEADGSRVEAWLRARSGQDDLIVSDWVVAEFSAAISIKLRTKQINTVQREAALKLFGEFCELSATVLPVERAQFRAAAHFADRYRRGLKGGEALHFAIAFDHGATLCTLDRRLRDAGAPLGVATLFV